MKIKSFFLLTLCVFVFFPMVAAAENNAAVSVAQSSIESMVTEKYLMYKTKYNLPDGAGVVVYIETPEGSAGATAGFLKGADETWHYRIASVSKTFTAASIMLLDQQGLLDIDDYITDMIPGKDIPYVSDSLNYAIPNKERITIRHILSHRAGIFDVFNNPVPESSPYPYAGQYYNYYVYEELKEPDHTFTADELFKVVAANKLSTGEPGVEYHYSDTGYTLLAKIVERVTAKSYDRFLKDNFFVPLGLNNTSAPWNGNDIGLPEPYLIGFVSDGLGFFEIAEDNMSSQVGPGNIISTPVDIARWIRSILSGRGPLTKEQIARMTLVPAGNATYALGIGNSLLGMGHSGAHPGYVNLVGYNPDDDVAVVVATPFIDYTNLNDHLAFMVEIGKEAKALAGYPKLWTQRMER
ncbi:D-alanyl-D-alanine carboxypeptidase [bioreactor metagenome]|jgi:D-alanyl-D-alanine carboxypeptidase|uniref:D-alanyl-D-alanine carboxypeptidase n=1 Tax=bioreactor metagenome TaxID=1076179 RepID=A0A644TVJ7_9ZZZZ|nr:beta-lactamase family protein [Treponema sp.]VBB39313.1 putative Serine-type D-Ala-D-Ala carboxypeptidase [uncultured Spirochaetota bacterium]HOI23763.1 serine hydrolase domain-containing protein [Spirochaetales bacterium]